MRFDKETRAAIHEAAPGSATIRWPAGAGEPQKGRVYWMQSLEGAREAEEKDKRHRQEHPETLAEAMAQMHERYYGKKPERYKPRRRRRSTRRPKGDDPQIMVLDVTVLGRGWEATVTLFEDPDPKRHTGIKAKVAAGPNPLFGHHEKTETEPEEIIVAPSRSEREDQEDAIKAEHAVSVDHAEARRLERKLVNQRRKGKRSKLTEEALERATRRREVIASAEDSV